MMQMPVYLQIIRHVVQRHSADRQQERMRMMLLVGQEELGQMQHLPQVNETLELLIVMLEREQSISKGEELIEIQMTLQKQEMMPQAMILFVRRQLAR
jgi:hypothetical protein